MKYYVEGTEEVLRQLQGLRKTEIKKAIRKGSRAAAKLIAARAKENVSVATGELRKAIKVRSLPRSRRWSGTQVTTRVAEGPTYYGGFVELGTKKMKARRYLRDAVDTVKVAASEAFVAGIVEGIEQGVKKA